MTEKEAGKFAEAEAEVHNITNSKHQNEIELMTKAFNMYINGFNLIGSFTPTEDNEIEYAWLLCTVQSFNSLRCAIWLISHGYYGQAMALLRTTTEDWFICNDCCKHPPTLDALYGRGEMPSYSAMARRANKRSIYEGDYMTASQFVHSTNLSLRILLDTDTNTLRTAPTYDEVLLMACCELFFRNAIRMTEFLYSFLHHLSEEKAEAWVKVANPCVQECGDWLRNIQGQNPPTAV